MKSIIAILIFFTTNTWALTFATENCPPFNYINDDGHASGTSVEIISEMLKRTNIRASIEFYPWARAYKMANTLRDVCAFTTSRTEDRERNFKWVGPLGLDSWTLYAKADSQIFAKTLADVLVYKIGALNEGGQASYLKANGFKVETASSEQLNYRKLLLGRFDLWAVGSSTAEWIAKNEGVPIKKILNFRKMKTYIACNPSVADSDIETMNSTLRQMRIDRYSDRVIEAYKTLAVPSPKGDQ